MHYRRQAKRLCPRSTGFQAYPVAVCLPARVRRAPPGFCPVEAAHCPVCRRPQRFQAADSSLCERLFRLSSIVTHPHTPGRVRDEAWVYLGAARSPAETPSRLEASAGGRRSFLPSPDAHAQSRDSWLVEYQSTAWTVARWRVRSNKGGRDHSAFSPRPPANLLRRRATVRPQAAQFPSRQGLALFPSVGGPPPNSLVPAAH